MGEVVQGLGKQLPPDHSDETHPKCSPVPERKPLHLNTDQAQQQQQQQQQTEHLLCIGKPDPPNPSHHEDNTISRPSPDPKKSSSVSPNSRRLLPTTPLSASPKLDPIKSQSEDGDATGGGGDSLMKKFRYDTLKKKKESKKPQRNSSTFYLINSVHSEPNLSALTNSSPTASPKSPKLNNNNNNNNNNNSNGSPTAAATKKKGESPLAKNKDSPLSKSRDGNLHALYLKKRGAGGKSSSLPSVITEKQTHVALYKFIPRHKDELALTEGDPIHVTKMHEDLWYEGINISSGKHGMFPCRYVADIMADEVECTGIEDPADHKQFHLRFLGSVEVQDHKGDEILLYAIARVVNQRSMLSSANPPTCVLQVSGSGVRICNMVYGSPNPPPQEGEKKGRKGGKHTTTTTTTTTTDGQQQNGGCEGASEESHYFSLKNVTFCGNHPKDKRYFGFITKHPDEYRFACHVMMSKHSTDPIAKIFGQCFEKFYANFMEYRASTEDIYLE